MYLFITLRFFLVFGACLFFMALQAQYYFEKLTEENGLSDNRVTCFLKDKTGFMWIGTKNGLNRYDGTSFKVFKPGPGNAISNEVINDIVQSTSGKIWVATMQGINIYDPDTNRWENMMPGSGDFKNDLPNSYIWDLYADDKNQIWIVSDVWEFSSYDPDKKKFTYYDWPTFARQQFFESIYNYRSIKKMAYKSESEFWLATNIGLFSLDTRSKKFQFHGGEYISEIRALSYDPEFGNVFVVTDNEKLFCYDEKKTTYTELMMTPGSLVGSTQSYRKDPNAYWHLAHPRGMLEINRKTREAVVITHQSPLPSSLLPGGVKSIYADDTNLTWIATNNGINKYNKNNISANFIPLTAASANEAEDGMGGVIYDPVEGNYFVASITSKTVFTINGNSGKIDSIKSIAGKLLSACLNFYIDIKKNIWLLTETNVYRYNRLDGKFILFPTPNKTKDVVFRDMLEDENGNYWFATRKAGLYLYKSAEKEFYIFSEKDSLYAVPMSALANDPIDHAIWIGTSGAGVYRYDLQTGHFLNYSETPDNPEYSQLSVIEDIEPDASGKLWFTTYGSGLFVYRHGLSYEKCFTHLTPKQGLSNGGYFSISSDNTNRLWLLGGKGLSVIDTTGRFLYDIRGHPAMSFANFATELRYVKRLFFNPGKNEILVAVSGGLLFYYPDKKKLVNSFPVVITDISVGGRSVMYDSTFSNKKNIELPYKSNSVSFQFAALNFNSQQDVVYEYKLHESDAQWKSAGNTNTVNFPDLPSGHYTFTIRAKNPDGHFSIASFSFRILPPFWKTWWFIALLAAAFGFGLYKWITSLRKRIRSERILNYFATSLYGQNTVEDIFWDIAKNCITQLNFRDCVIYQYDEHRQVLIQKSAYGPKNPVRTEILNPIDIPVGKGITGTVAATGKAEIVHDTSKDNRYIVDDKARLSELTVPILVDGKVFGIIDSEHPRKNFYSRGDLKLLAKIADICATKISRYQVEEKLRAKIARDLHDEMGSTLTSINIISKMAMEQGGDNEIQKNHFRHIKEYSGRMMESMSDMVWAINPANDTLDKLLLRMKEFAAEILEPARMSYSFTGVADMDIIKLNPEQRKDLYLLFKEALTNAVKYSAATTIKIGLEEQNGFLMMHIIDNGKGFDPGAKHKGNGLKNMRSRAAQLNAEYHIWSAINEGTAIHTRLPITQ